MDSARDKLTLNKIRKPFALALLPVVLLLTAYAAGEILIVKKPLPQADAIFVLSGSTGFGERTATAAKVFHSGVARKIIVANAGEQTGWQPETNHNPFSWEWDRASLQTDGVPDNAIEVLLAPIVKSTHDEAVLLAKIARERGWQRVLIVTSPFHTRRALWTAERAVTHENLKVEIGILPADEEKQTIYWWTRWRNWRTVASEYLKLIYYQIFYR